MTLTVDRVVKPQHKQKQDQTDDLHLAKLPTTPILNRGNLIINYLITIFICNPFQKFLFKLP